MIPNLGLLEERVLLLVMILEEAYGVSVAEAYEKQLEKSISVPAVHTVLKRLEKKGMLQSKVGEPLRKRGGRRKVLYEATELGYRTVKETMEAKIEIWNMVPKFI